MSKSDEEIENLLKACRDEKSIHDIVSKNKILVKYTGKELNDMEDIPNWEYLMSAAEKLYDQFEEEFEDGTFEWTVFAFAPSRFMVWGDLADFIEWIDEQEAIDKGYE